MAIFFSITFVVVYLITNKFCKRYSYAKLQSVKSIFTESYFFYLYVLIISILAPVSFVFAFKIGYLILGR